MGAARRGARAVYIGVEEGLQGGLDPTIPEQISKRANA
jgi:hypothetical protein